MHHEPGNPVRLRRLLRVALILSAMLVAVLAFIWIRWFTPSGDLADYNRYLLPAADGSPGGGALAVTYLGTTTLLIDDGDTQLMIDGFLSRPSPWTVMTSTLTTDTALVDRILERAGAVRLKALFVVHSHYDHALDAPYIARTTGAQLHGSQSTLNIGRGGGLGNNQLSLFDPGREIAIGQFTVTILPSKHTPPTFVNDNLGITIEKPLTQPAKVSAFTEGGTFDVLIRHSGHALLVKASSNYLHGALDGVKADVLFLATAQLGHQSPEFQDTFYAQTVSVVRPRLVIPIHWDDFFAPLSTHLTAPYRIADDLPAGFDALIRRLEADGLHFGLMQGFQRVLLFNDGG